MWNKTNSTVLNTFNHLNIINCIFGINFYQSKGNKILEKLSIIYTSLMLCITLTLPFYKDVVFQNYPVNHHNKNPLTRIIFHIEYYLGYFTIISIYYQIIFHWNTIKLIINEISKIEKLFYQHLNSVYSNQKINNLRQLIYIQLLFILVAIFGYFATLCYHSRAKNFIVIIMEYLVTINPMVLTYLTLCKFLNLSWMLHAKFQALNKYLQRQLCIRKNNEFLKNNDKNQLLMMGLFIVVNECPTPNQIYMNKLKIICRIYDRLYCTISLMNDAFGLTNLMTVGQASISVTCHLFVIFKLLLKTKSSDDIDNDEHFLFGIICKFSKF